MGHGLLPGCLWGYEILCALPSPNPPPGCLSRTPQILSRAAPECSSAGVVASGSCQELLFYEVSVIPWDRWELLALHSSDFYPCITSREREMKSLFEASEAGPPNSIVLAKDALCYFVGNSCKTPINVHNVQGHGFQMALQHLGWFPAKVVADPFHQVM